MPSNDGFERFGSPGRFMLDLRLLPDPDGESAAPAASAGSWGQWRLSVNGLTLTEHMLTLANGETQRRDHVTWYLAPLLRWLAVNWTPLLHEERLPGLVRRARTAREAYLSIADNRMDDAAAFGPWQAWARRHSLRWAAEGGMVPDVFLRRVGDDIEVSWGNRWQPGAEAADYLIEPGLAHCTVREVATALDKALRWAAQQQPIASQPWAAEFLQALKARPRRARDEPCIAWFLDGQALAGQLTRRFRAALAATGASSLAPPTGAFEAHALARFSPAAAMFGALSPRISQGAAINLLAAMNAPGNAGPYPIDQYVRAAPAWQSDRPWEDGYRLALDLYDDLGLVPSETPLDVTSLLQKLGVTIRDISLDEDGPLGVTLAGDEIPPTILVNEDHAQNHRPSGRRFTLAHELCHLLHDRDRARRVTHTCTPWAPASVEQRANAFAAMLLMPRAAVQGAFAGQNGRPNLSDVQTIAQKFQVGLRAAIQHFANLGEITDDDRERLLDAASSQ